MLASWVAALFGVMLIFMGGGHLYGVISVALAQSRPFDHQLVSLIATGSILAYPGLLSAGLCRWLWQGRSWAYAMCVAAAAPLMIYLILLLIAEALPGRSPDVGSELPLATVVAGTLLATLIAVWASLRNSPSTSVAVDA
jgi:hypothetical protein